MEDLYYTYEYTYKVKGCRLKIKFFARDDDIAKKIIDLNNLIETEYPLIKRLKRKRVYINKQPYILEQDLLNRLRKIAEERGIKYD